MATFSNFLTLRNSNLANFTVQNLTGSTIGGISTVIGSTITYSTMSGKALTTSSITVASTVISLGTSTNQSSINFSGGSYTTGWMSTLNSLTAISKVTMSYSGQYQYAVQNSTSVSQMSQSNNSGVSWQTLGSASNGLPTGSVAYQATASGNPAYTSFSESATGQYAVVCASGGQLYTSNNAASATPVFTAANIGGQPYLYFPFENSAVDMMGNSVVTLSSSAPTYTAGKIGSYAMRVTNSAGGNATQYLRASWAGATNFTVSFWFSAQSVGAVQVLWGAYNSQTVGYINASNQLQWNIISNGGTVTVGTSSTITSNTWYHVTYVFQTAGYCYFYLNGVQCGSYLNVGGMGMTTAAVGVGAYDAAVNNAFNGTIDDFRIYNFAAFYAIPPYLYLPFENASTDSMGNSTGTVTGSISYAAGQVGSYALSVTNPGAGTSGNVATNYIRYTIPSAMTSITVSGWFYSTTTAVSSYPSIFTMYNMNVNLFLYPSTNQLYFSFPGGNINTSFAISTNTWYSFICIFQVGTCYLYVNNVLIGTGTGTGGGFGSYTSLGICTYDNGTANQPFSGRVDDFRVYNYVTAFQPIVPANWLQTAVSGGGQYMLATSNTGLFLSSNYGVAWTQVVAIGSWTGLGVSTSGQYMVALSQVAGYAPYYSINYGVTWSTATFDGVSGSFVAISGNGQYSLTGYATTALLISNYLAGYGTSTYGTPTFSPSNSATINCASISATGQYMLILTQGSSNNVYYSTNYGVSFTGITVGSTAMTGCAISADGSYLTVSNATTVYTLNLNATGYSVSIGNAAGVINQGQNTVAIGNAAGATNQSAGSIILNGTGSALNAYAPGLFVGPIASYSLSYSSSFSILGYGTDSQVVQSNITALPSGYVGIGTATPGATLQINDATSSASSVPLMIFSPNLSASGSQYLYFGTANSSNNTAQLGWYSVSAGSALNYAFLQIYGKANIMTWQASTGNVGIGITNPVKTFQVAGNATIGYIAGSKTGLYFNNEDAYGTTPSIQGISSAFGVNALSINPAGGSVGIGTTNPVSVLHVNGTGGVNSTATLTISNGSNSNTGYGAQLLFSNYFNASSPYSLAQISALRVNNAADFSAYLAFSTETAAGTLAENMRIMPSGYVGIGTVSPSYLLDVNGSARISTGISIAGGNVINFGYDQTKEANAGKIGYQTFTTTSVIPTTGALDIVGAGPSGSNRVVKIFDTLTVATNVGIGTNVPGWPLHVIGNINVTGSILYNGTAITTGTGSIWTAGSGGVAYYTSGWVGIGVASPIASLQITNGSNAGAGRSQCLYVYSKQAGIMLDSGLSSGHAWNIWSGENDIGDPQNLNFFNQTRGAFAMCLQNSTGYVGLSVTSPSYQLHLSSDSAAKPTTSTWTVSSDERLKENIVLADVDRCIEIIRAVPLKHYRWKDDVYTLDQVKDRSKLGWIAQDVEKVFPKAVGTHPFHYHQVYEDVVQDDGSKMKKLISEDVIEDCRDLNADQLYAVMYGAIQKLILENDTYKINNAAMSEQFSTLSASHARLLAWAQTQGFS